MAKMARDSDCEEREIFQLCAGCASNMAFSTKISLDTRIKWLVMCS
jgi:hypothetical protein